MNKAHCKKISQKKGNIVIDYLFIIIHVIIDLISLDKQGSEYKQDNNS